MAEPSLMGRQSIAQVAVPVAAAVVAHRRAQFPLFWKCRAAFAELAVSVMLCNRADSIGHIGSRSRTQFFLAAVSSGYDAASV